MATVSDLIRRSLKKLGVLAGSETPTAAEQSDAFEELNEMIDEWAAEGLAVSTFATVDDEVDLAPGYARALRYNLAVALAPDYGYALPGEIAGPAAESKTIIKRTEFVSEELTSDPALLTPGATDLTSLE